MSDIYISSVAVIDSNDIALKWFEGFEPTALLCDFVRKSIGKMRDCVREWFVAKLRSMKVEEDAVEQGALEKVVARIPEATLASLKACILVLGGSSEVEAESGSCNVRTQMCVLKLSNLRVNM
jgi:hypothetical protein